MLSINQNNNMRRMFSLLFILFLGLNLEAQTYSVEVEFTNISKPSGSLVIAIFNNESSYINEKNPYLRKIVPIHQKGKLSIVIDLPKGSYVIAVFQDMNKNNTLDYNFIGIPKEPFAFSNNPSCLEFPKYKDLQIHIKSNQKIPLKLIDLLN